jgi:glycosyltransferase involved in cell wall biosynthesis
MRLAWFSPMPPVPSGVAVCSAELVSALSTRHQIDVYGDEDPVSRASGADSAHAFVSRHPYDLTVYQVGNSSHHDYLWPYLFRYPGLTVLHDAHLHHARAASLLRTKRAADYRTEFAASHPDADPGLAELAIAGFDNHLYYSFPMTRLIVQASRLTAVHTVGLAADLNAELPDAPVRPIRLAHGRAISDVDACTAGKALRARYGIADEATVFGVFGGLTPEKRIPQILDAIKAILPYAPAVHLLFAGAPARHYDVAADVHARGLNHCVTITGYVESEDELTALIAGCDVSLNLRWPTAREVSGPWLRALGAGRPTVITDLAHLWDVPSLDPRTWKVRAGSGMRGPECGTQGQRSVDNTEHPRIPRPDRGSPIPDPDRGAPICVAIDILDEDHSLRLAMRRLATDAGLRASLGAAGQRYWTAEHSMPSMVEDYERVLIEAASRPAPSVPLPAHLVTNGDVVLKQILDGFGLETSRLRPVPANAWSKL